MGNISDLYGSMKRTFGCPSKVGWPTEMVINYGKLLNDICLSKNYSPKSNIPHICGWGWPRCWILGPSDELRGLWLWTPRLRPPSTETRCAQRFGISVSHQYWEQLRQVVHQLFFQGRILIPMISVYISYEFISAAYGWHTQPSWRSSRFQVAAALVGQLCQNRLQFGQRLQAADAGVEGLDKSLVPSGNAPWLSHQSSNYSHYICLAWTNDSSITPVFWALIPVWIWVTGDEVENPASNELIWWYFWIYSLKNKKHSPVSDNPREPLQTGQPWHRQAILKVGQARDGGFHMIIGLLAGGLPWNTDADSWRKGHGPWVGSVVFCRKPCFLPPNKYSNEQYYSFRFSVQPILGWWSCSSWKSMTSMNRKSDRVELQPTIYQQFCNKDVQVHWYTCRFVSACIDFNSACRAAVVRFRKLTNKPCNPLLSPWFRMSFLHLSGSLLRRGNLGRRFPLVSIPYPRAPPISSRFAGCRPGGFPRSRIRRWNVEAAHRTSPSKSESCRAQLQNVDFRRQPKSWNLWEWLDQSGTLNLPEKS